MRGKIWGFHGGDYEECRLLGYKNSVRTSQKTHYVSAREPSRLVQCKIWVFIGRWYYHLPSFGIRATEFVCIYSYRLHLPANATAGAWSSPIGAMLRLRMCVAISLTSSWHVAYWNTRTTFSLLFLLWLFLRCGSAHWEFPVFRGCSSAFPVAWVCRMRCQDGKKFPRRTSVRMLGFRIRTGSPYTMLSFMRTGTEQWFRDVSG
jgi:hypothetical protein